MENFYTVRDVTKILGLTIRHVGRMCKDGTFKGAKLFGRMYIIPKESVEQYLKAKKDKQEKSK
jgi:excisionase family DNA binding protein